MNQETLIQLLDMHFVNNLVEDNTSTLKPCSIPLFVPQTVPHSIPTYFFIPNSAGVWYIRHVCIIREIHICVRDGRKLSTTLDCKCEESSIYMVMHMVYSYANTPQRSQEYDLTIYKFKAILMWLFQSIFQGSHSIPTLDTTWPRKSTLSWICLVMQSVSSSKHGLEWA